MFFLDHPGWQWRDDSTRGPKDFIITGRWTAQGHNRFGIDPTYAAGVAGKLEAAAGGQCPTGLNDCLAQYAIKASTLLRRWRPDIIEILESKTTKKEGAFYDEDSPFGYFHLFMSPRGVAKMHVDRNDLVSLLFLISSDPNSDGSLEIGGSQHCFDWTVGDLVILDSASLYHGTRRYTGEFDNRIVGIWMIHKTFLAATGVL
ncbi:MAG: hypothetical protein ACXV2C_00010 [Candidatus Bathyarchaeia archaeon]